VINVVIDTNIVISTALSKTGNPAKIVNHILDKEEIQIFYTTKIFAEYKKVLAYKRLNIDVESQKSILKEISEIGILIEPTPSTIPMLDETDRIFYDTARESGATLITGNTKHYPSEAFIMTPGEFFTKLAQGF